jgi:hypothetical protein
MSKLNHNPLVSYILPVWPEVLNDYYFSGLEVYKSGEICVCPGSFYEDFELVVDWLCFGDWYIDGYIPEFCVSMLSSPYRYRVFTLKGEIYIINGDVIVKALSNYWHGTIYTYSEFLSEFMIDLAYIVPQAGICNDDIDLDYKYSKSKTRKRWKNKKAACVKLEKVSEQLSTANLGSRKKKTKKKFKKKLKTNHVSTVGPQSGVDIYEDIPNIEMQSGTEINVPEILTLLEKMLGLYILKYYNHPIYTAFSSILLLFKSSVSISLYDTLVGLISNFKDSKATLGNFTEWMKELVTNVDKFKNNRFANSFMEFILKCWTTILCPTVLFDWTENCLYKAISHIFSLFSTNNNPLESIIWALTYVVNAIDVYVKDGTLDGFLVTETSTDELARRLRELRCDFKLYSTGDLEFIKGHKQFEFLVRLDTFLIDLNRIRKSKRGMDLKVVDDWIKEVDAMVVECQRVEAHSGSRIQPYMFLIFSGSGISKTHLLQLFASTIAIHNNIPFAREFIFFLNQGNKFQSGWKNFITVWLIDDSGALSSEYVHLFLVLADWILRASNNFPHELAGADLKDKGTLFNRALVGGWASNSMSQDVESVARFPSALQRRFQVKIHGEVKPEYRKLNTDENAISTSIDYSRMTPEQRESICPDAWLFTCYECEIQDIGFQIKDTFMQPVKEYDNLHRYVIAKDCAGSRMERRSLEDTLKFLQWHSKKHFDGQLSVLKVNEKVYDKTNYCLHGLPLGLHCDKCQEERETFEKLALYDISEASDEDSLPSLLESSVSSDNLEVLVSKDDDISLANSYDTAVEDDFVHHEYEYIEESINEEVLEGEQYASDISSASDSIYSSQGLYDNSFDYMQFSLRCQSGVDKRIVYCKKLMDLLGDMRIKNMDITFLQTSLLIHNVKKLSIEVKNLMNNWFTGFVSDIVLYITDRLFIYIEDFITNPLDFIPVFLEDTALACYAYSKHPLIRFGMALDYINYLYNYKLLNVGVAHDSHSLDYGITTFMYNNFVRTPTKAEKKEEERWEPMSLSKFSTKILRNITRYEKCRKISEPDLIRDVLLPIGLSYTTISMFIPMLVDQFSTLYCEIQVGYDMSVEEVKQSDNATKQEWYKNKQEVFLNKASVTSNRSPTELENVLSKNMFFVRNTCSKKIVSALSFANQYVILPYHFVYESIGNILQFVKTEVPSYENCGNAIIEVQLSSDNIYRLPGDLCVMFLEKHMDHLRTKDLLDSFPTSPIIDKCVGRLLFKKSLGVKSMLDTKDIVYSSSVTNNSPHEESSFPGYLYSCDNFSGLCGAVLFDETRKVSSILGIHVGGNTSNKISVASTILRGDLEKAIEYFSNGVLLQSGFDFEHSALENYTPKIYRKNPFLDTVDRLDGVQLLGSANVRYSYNNKVVYTPICEDVKQAFKVETEYVAPPFKYDDDKRHGVRQLIRAFSRKNTVRDVGLVRKAQSDLKDRFLYPLLYGDDKDFWQQEIRILNEFEVVNGVLGKRFLGGMNMSSAFGAGYIGSKSQFAVQNSDNTWSFFDWVMERVREYKDMMDRGIIVPDIVIQQLKLEATTVEKANIGKVRSFFMSSTFIQMILRELLLTTCRYACLNTRYTEIVVGINAHSTDWTKFVMEITRYGKNRMVALDLANMDATVMFEVMSGCIDIFFSPFNIICNKSGKYNNRLSVLKNMLLFPLIDVHGDLVSMTGMLPSGTPLTSMLGCLINSTYYRMAFHYLYSGPRVFSDLVTLRVYGDDSIANVSKDANFFTVSNVLKAWDSLGILGTDMEKKGRTSNKRFYKLHEVEFLKRRLVYVKEFGMVVAPLSKKSMFKCIMCHVPPRTVTLEFLTGQCIDNFLFEAKFHGKQFYEDSRRKLRIIATKHDLLRFCNLLEVSFSEMVEKWKVDNDDCVLVTEQWRKCQPLWFRLAQEFSFDIQNWSVWTQSTTENYKLNDENQRVTKLGVVSDGAQLQMQSGVEKDEEQVVTFVQTEEPMMLNLSGARADTRLLHDNISLSDFLKRPLLIKTVSWGAGPIHTDVDPWVSLLSNPRIQNRINNFQLFRGTCHVKFLLNGNGFFYGRMMASYLPFSELTFTRPVSSIGGEDLLVPISQYPRVFLDPSTSGGAEMVLPFFYPYPYISLTDNLDFRRLGTIYFNPIANLRHSSQDLAVSNERVTISVYAWFEDVEVQGPTYRYMTDLAPQAGPPAARVIPQSGREEESVEKPISQAATNVASVARNVTSIPGIGPYALAVEKAATVTSNIASILGYCKPIAVAEPEPLIPRPTGSLAVTNSTSNSIKLSLDVKQETSISPMDICLSAEDQMSLNYITGRDSYLNQFEWQLSASTGSLLQSYVVTPWTYRRGTVDTERISMTAVCGVANCFKYWTGSLIYRFQIIKSAFHRGRLAIIYDPFGTQLNREDNVNFSHIVDIGETSDFEVRIGNYQDREWLGDSVNPLLDWPNSSILSTLPMTASGNLNRGENGVISIYVVNELTAPSSPTVPNDITIACYVRAGNDFQLADPHTVGKWQTIAPQSGIEDSGQLINPDNVGVGVRSVTHASDMNPQINKLYMGEVVTNFRTLLKRDSYYATIVDSNTGIIDYFVHPMYPFYPQLQNDFPIAAARNKCAMTMMNYVMLAFSGYKGACRWKISSLCQNTTQILVTRGEEVEFVGAEFSRGSKAYVDESTLCADAAEVYGNSVMRGAVLTMGEINPVVDFEMPFYNEAKFFITRTDGASFYVSHPYNPLFKYTLLKTTVGSSIRNVINLYASAGEDFSCYFFVGWPPLYRNT